MACQIKYVLIKNGLNFVLHFFVKQGYLLNYVNLILFFLLFI